MSIYEPVPSELLLLDPIMKAIGMEWSTHYHPPNEPEKRWCLVREGRAGRVGMSIKEAQEEVINLIVYKHMRLRNQQEEFLAKLSELVSDELKK